MTKVVDPSQSVNRRDKISASDAALRASAREELLTRALTSKPGTDGLKDGEEIRGQIQDGPTGV